ncbi:hypothetical protein TNCV_3361471 [Trichonephila clavipes]|nr:hypothetical protein TNCV_3361471 [Trichonephila clavipes]
MILTRNMSALKSAGFYMSSNKFRTLKQQYGRWNWRNDPYQHPDTITGARYNVYYPQLPSPSYHHQSFSLQRTTMYPRNQRLLQRPTVLRQDVPTFYPVKEPKKIL